MQLSQAVREYLAKTDSEFNHLNEKHKKFEEELASLAEKGGLTPDEEMKIADMKKKKLSLKDKMLLIAKKHEKELEGLG